MSQWILATGGRFAKCGHGDGHDVPRDTPLRHVAGSIFRCPEHSSVPVDWDAIDALLRARDAEQGQPVNVGADRGFSRAGESLALNTVLKNAGILGRKQRRSSPKPYSQVANDPAVQRAQEAK